MSIARLMQMAAAGAGGGGFNLNNASYDGVSFGVGGQDVNPMKVKFNLDGTKMFIMGFTSDAVFQYSLSTGFDLNTASYDSVSFSVASQEASPSGLEFNSDGTKMYVCGFSSDAIFEYPLSTAFNLSTAYYSGNSFSTASQENQPRCISFNDDGTKMYIGGTASDTVFQYSLSTGFAVSTASYDNISFNMGAEAKALYDLRFNLNGTKMFIMDETSRTVYQCSLSTVFDLSTASYNGVSFSAADQGSQTRGLTFNADGTKMYIVASGNDTIFQYSTA